jgi:hypothetical protein
MRRARAAITGLAAALLSAGATAGTCGAAALPTTTVGVDAHVAAHARPLPQDFLSVSVEFDTIPQWAGRGRVSPVLRRLVAGLDPSGHPIIRVGGQGGDRTWWPVAGVTRPPGVSNTLSPRWIQDAKRLAGGLDARYLLQVNLEAGSTQIAHAEGEHFLHGLGAADIAALEIGNEPELYDSIAWYWENDGQALPWYDRVGMPVYARDRSYGADAFAAQWRQFAGALPPQLVLAGPDLAADAWLPEFAAQQLRRGSRLRDLDVHVYPVEKCVRDPTSPRYPTVAHLLTPAASRSLLGADRAYIARAHAVGARFLVDEAGADSCGGNPGVSNTMASALWVLDMLFAMDRDGVDGVDLHDLPGTVNTLFDLRGHGTRAHILPTYLGARVFAQAAPAGSRLLAVSDPDTNDLRAWATQAADGTERVVLINDGPAREVLLRLAATLGRGGRRRRATLERLHAQGAASTSGFVLGGRRVSVTRTGEVQPGHTPGLPLHHGVARVAMGAGSVALVTVAPPGARGTAGTVIDRG